MRKEAIASVRDLVEALGGPKSAGEVLGTTPQNVVNWRLAGKIPARFHIVHSERLAERGISVPPSLWGFVQDSAA